MTTIQAVREDKVDLFQVVACLRSHEGHWGESEQNTGNKMSWVYYAEASSLQQQLSKD